MSLSPLTVALAPIMVALLATMTFVASLGTDNPAARTVDIKEPASGSSIQVNPSVSIPRPGVSGSIVSGPELADFDHDGVSEAVFGTQRGFYRVAAGDVVQYIPTSTEVRDFVHVGDVSGDDIDDVALALGDTTFPNIRVYDSATGEEMWTYVPAQDVFLDNLMWTSQQSATFDLITADTDGDGDLELLATSGYRLYALDAASGVEKWRYEWRDNLWRVAATGDVDADGSNDLVVGSQDGFVIAISGGDGREIWSKQIALPFQAMDDKGRDWKLIDRSAWDIVLAGSGSDEAIVTFEDGYVRRIDLKTGDLAWEEELFTLPVALLSQNYRQRGGHPTSPGDPNFFNLKAKSITDISGDGQADVLITAFQGVSGSQDSRTPGIFAIDSGNGRVLWRNTTTDVTSVARLDVFETAGGPVLAVPAKNPAFLELATGRPAPGPLFELTSSQNGSRQGGAALLALGGEDYLLAAPNGDLGGTTGGVEWNIARVTQSKLMRGDFTGDSGEDILVVSGSSGNTQFGFEPRARLVYVIDGNSGKLAWEYMVPHDLFKATGGIAGVKATKDLTGDGKQDVIGYMQDISELNGNEGESPGADSRVVLLDGASGQTVFNGSPVKDEYYGLWELVHRGDPGLTSIIQSRVSGRIGGNLESQWQGEQQNRRDVFEQELGQRWGAYRYAQVQEFLSGNSSGGSEAELRAQNELKLDADWAAIASQQTSDFEANLLDELDDLRAVGADEVLATAYENRRHSDFAGSLEQQRLDTYSQWRADFESRIQVGEFNSTDGLSEFEVSLDQSQALVEQSWRDEFEASLDQQRVDWIDEQTGGSLEIEVQNELASLQRQLAESGSWIKVDKRIVALDVISYPGTDSGSALFVSGARDVFIIDTDGELLWTRSYNPDVYNTPLGGPETDMSFGLPVNNQQPVRTVPDRNGDGIDDLRLVSGRSILFAESDLTTGELRFKETQTFIGPAGDEGNGAVAEVQDLNMDGHPEVAMILWRDNAPPEASIVDGITGSVLLQLDNFDENSVSLEATADFNGDSRPDVLMFERWVEGRQGPRLRVLAAGTGQTLWEFSEYRDLFVLDQSGFQGPIIPAAAIDDLTGDGVPEVAVVKHLTWQAGGSIDIFDITRDQLISSVVTEESNPASNQEKLWHPGLLSRDVGDLNGDGTGEVAFVTAFGSSGTDKEYRLGVADVAAGSVIAEFMVTGTSLMSLEAPGKFGVAGFSGDLFLLDVNNELNIELPGGTGNVSSPVTLEWQGAAPGSFSQVFVDGTEVARTNGEVVELNMRSGDHTVAVRSVDPSGRAVISNIEFNVSKSQAARNIILVLAMLVALGTLWVPGRRIFEKSRVRAAASA